MFLAAVLVVLLVASLVLWCRYILQRCARPFVWTLLALAAPGVFAADWYVDGKTGSDQNAGSKTAPFKNIWRGWKAATAGDTVRILPSTEYGPQYFSGKSGAPGKPITIQAEGRSPHMTRISGRGINFGIMLDTSTNHVRNRNLDVTAPGHGLESGWAAVYLTSFSPSV